MTQTTPSQSQNKKNKSVKITAENPDICKPCHCGETTVSTGLNLAKFSGLAG